MYVYMCGVLTYKRLKRTLIYYDAYILYVWIFF